MAREAEITTIQISKETRDELANLGKKGETYDEIIKKLIHHAVSVGVRNSGDENKSG